MMLLSYLLGKDRGLKKILEGMFTTAEMVKRDGEWYARFTLKKTVEVPEEPETVIAIDRGERN